MKIFIAILAAFGCVSAVLWTPWGLFLPGLSILSASVSLIIEARGRNRKEEEARKAYDRMMEEKVTALVNRIANLETKTGFLRQHHVRP